VEGSCEHDNEPTGSIKCWEVLEKLHNWQLLKKGSAPRVSNSEIVHDIMRTTHRHRTHGRKDQDISPKIELWTEAELFHQQF
jgi:hypothetical protein